MRKPIVWSIAGSDSGGGAGLQADLHTIQALNGYPCTIVTALTAQNTYQVSAISYSSPALIAAQFATLESDLPAKTIKVGMLGDVPIMKQVVDYIKDFPAPVICDPVMMSSTDVSLIRPEAKDYFIEHILPIVDLLNPNRMEAEAIIGREINSVAELPQAAEDMLKMGAKAVMIKGGHVSGPYSQDFFSDGERQLWLTNPRLKEDHNHGAGCVLSSAIATAMAHGYDMVDAMVIAKAYVMQGIRSATKYGEGPGPVNHLSWPTNQADLPWITREHQVGLSPKFFEHCSESEFGLYPVVDNIDMLRRVCSLGVNAAQLRLPQSDDLSQQINTAILVAKQYDVKLFISNHWQLAIEHGAYGVHLSQHDLPTSNVDAIADAGLCLGIAAHGYADVARALVYGPSYIAIGPIYESANQPDKTPLGLDELRYWQDTLDIPVIAYGGINIDLAPEVLKTGVKNVAMLSAIANDSDPDAMTSALMRMISSVS